MQLLSLVMAAVAGMAAVASASPHLNPRGNQRPICYTQCASTYVKPRTRYTTRTIPCTKTVTATATSTVTPPQSIATATTMITTVETASTSTETDTEIDTEINTETNTSTAPTSTTYVSTVTTSVDTYTSTVSASSGFVPILDSLTGSQNTASGTSPNSKRDLVALAKARRNVVSPAYLRKNDYPKSVTCVYSVTASTCGKVTSTSTTVTTAAAPTTTTTVTSTETSTTYPSATTTTTTTTTLTTTTDTTTTPVSSATTTYTTASTTTTLYAACATNNFANQVDGHPIYSYSSGSFAQLLDLRTDTAYDCCVASLNIPGGGYADSFGFLVGGSSSNCLLTYYGSACSSQRSGNTVVTENRGPFIVGNGPCGKFTINSYYNIG